MQTIQINNPELEDFIKVQYGKDNESLLNDFMVFVKTELVGNDIKKGFDEVALYEQGKKELRNIEDVIARLKGGH